MSDAAKSFSWQDAIALLVKLGHAPAVQDAAENFLAWAESLKNYQAYHGLPETGVLDAVTVEHMQLPRCGLPDTLAASTALCKWPSASLTFFQQIVYPGVDPATVEANYVEALRRWEVVSGLQFTEVSSPNQARIYAVGGQIDGPGNILAESELPCGYSMANTAHQTFDQADARTLTETQRIACMCHEIGHALGLSHAAPNSANLMAPVLSSIGAPQAGDIAEIQSRYGPPVVQPTPTPPTPIPAPSDPAAGDVFGAGVVINIPAAGNYLFRLSLAKR